MFCYMIIAASCYNIEQSLCTTQYCSPVSMDRNRVNLALLLSFISHLCRVDAAFQYLNVTCAPDFGNYTEVSVYARNLDILLPELSSKGTTRAFHTSTAGAVPNKVYGLYQCRGDVSQDVCADCIQDAAEKIVQGCPLFAEAAVWYEECMLRYANHSISSVPETYPGYYLWSLRNFSDYGKSAPVLARTLHSVINDAAKISSKGHFATKSDNWTIFDNVYSLAQCTPDLTEFDCRNCLVEARSDMINVFNTSTRVAVFLASCQLRYDTTLKFYRDRTSEPPAPSPTNTSETDFLAGETTKTPHEESKLTTPIIAGIAVGAFVGVILLAAGVGFCVRQFRQRKIKVPSTTTTTVITSQPPGPPPPPKVKENDKNYGSTHDLGEVEFVQHDFATLKAATNGFSTDNKLGEGGFGVVYLGTLNNGQQVAIKRLSGNSGQGANEFMTEAQLVAKLQHRNLVKLLGFCSKGNEKLLVYEFLPNISLDSFLFDPKKRTNFDWEKRYKIIMGVARGIQYLHEDSRITIIHRDLKLSNILLDTDMNPKIADFGMARLFEREQQLANTKRVVGTRGYMAPEYVLAGEYSEKSDVYSFGIIILELISGQKNRMQYQSSQKEDLPILAWNLWDTGRSLEFMDPTLYNNCSKSEVMRCIQIGLLCVQHNAMYRPTMSTVVLMLTGNIALPPPTTPAMSPNQFNLPTSYDEDRRQSEEAASTKSVVWRSDIEQDLYP